MTDYSIPRSVGAVSHIPDMSRGPLPWWIPGKRSRPFGDVTREMVTDGLTAIGRMLQAHPTIPYFERIRRAFRTPGIDVFTIWPLHWSSTEWNYDRSVKNIRWLNIPPGIFELLYRHYGGQNKVIMIQPYELDWTVAGIGCRRRSRCLEHDGKYHAFREEFENGRLPCPMSWGVTDNHILACDAVKIERATRVLRELNELQAAAEAARANHPNAKLRVFHAPHVNFFKNEFFLVARDLIPRMDSPPDFIGLSLYRKAGDVVAAYENVRRWTGLPPDRIYIAEVGAREGTQRDGTVIGGSPQYERIMSVVEPLFDWGCPLAVVWSWEEVPHGGGHTGYSVNDAVTGEPLSGRRAITELNERWRE